MRRHMIRFIADLFENKNKNKNEHEHDITESDWERLKKAEQLSTEKPDSVIVCRGFGIIH